MRIDVENSAKNVTDKNEILALIFTCIVVALIHAQHIVNCRKMWKQ